VFTTLDVPVVFDGKFTSNLYSKLHLTDVGREDVVWYQLAQDTDIMAAFVYTLMNIRFAQCVAGDSSSGSVTMNASGKTLYNPRWS
jgi:hypothetical protein